MRIPVFGRIGIRKPMCIKWVRIQVFGRIR